MFIIAARIVLMVSMTLSVIYDVRYRRIPNKITGPAILSGILFLTLDGGLFGLKNSLFGLAIGFFVFLLPVLAGMIGAGDLKLVVAIGALTGPGFVMKSIVGTGLSGGVVVLAYVLYKGQLVDTVRNMIGLVVSPMAKHLYLRGFSNAGKVFRYFEEKRSSKPQLYIPYSIPIALGVLATSLGWLEVLNRFW